MRVSGGLDRRFLLEGEDIVEHALDTAPLEPVIGDEPGVPEQLAQPEAEPRVDPDLAPLEGLLERDQALIQDLQALATVENRVHALKT